MTGTSTGDAAGDVFNSIEGIIGTAYADTFVGSAGNDIFRGEGGYDTVDYSASTSAITLNYFGNASDASGTATGASIGTDTFNKIEIFIGSAFGDTFTSNAYYASFYGGKGNDLYIINSSTASIYENANEGYDTVQTSLSSYAIGNDIERLVYTGTANFTGTGNNGNNDITGGIGNDTLNGGDGNDVLTGGAGGDALNGGNGTDTASYANASSSVSINLTTGVKTGDAAGDVYNSIERIQGSNLADTFTASSAITLAGGAGNDTYFVNSTSVVVEENAGEGTDEIRTTVNISSVANVEKITYVGTGNFAGSGDDNSNTLTGGAGNDTLNGNGGDDVLVGNGGSNTLNGGSGADTADYSNASGGITVTLNNHSGSVVHDGATDTLSNIETVIGSSFADTFTSITKFDAGSEFYNQVDTLQGGDGNDSYWLTSENGDPRGNLNGAIVVEASNQGIDTVHVVFDYTLTANVENLVIETPEGRIGNGNELDNGIWGNAGIDYLYGLEGNDTVTGGASGDYIDGGSGSDRSVYANSNAAVQVDLGLGIASGGYAEGDTLISIENLTGSAWNDTLSGDGGSNSLIGGAGDDLITGRQGNDSLAGGNDNDSYYYAQGDGNDTVREFANGGSADNIIFSDVSSSSVSISREGNDLFLTISESFVGASDNGTIHIIDTLDDNFGEGIESFVFADNIVWSIQDVRVALIQQASTAGDDTILGFNTDDAINGGDGNDFIDGGAGNDTLTGGAGNDTFVFHAGFGQDTITDFTAGAGSVDVIQIDTNIFADFAAVMNAASQVGADTVITADASNVITLKNVTLSSLHQDDFSFAVAS